MVKLMLDRVDRLCTAAPTVLVLDDLHNADEASLLLWNRLSRSAAQLPLLLAAAVRPVRDRGELSGLRRAVRARGPAAPPPGRPATEVVTLLEQAVAGGLVVESGVRLAFRHPLFRQALYDAIPADERAALHRRAARSLADAGSPADRVAPQLLASAPPVEDWVRTWLGGTLPALALRAPTLAAELTERALDGMTADDPRREQLVATQVTG